MIIRLTKLTELCETQFNMMVSKREAKKNRQRALADTWERMTTVDKIRKLFASGRPRKHDQIVSPITAYGQAGELFERVQIAMTAGELDPTDVRASLVVNELGTEPLATITIPVGRSKIDAAIPTLTGLVKPIPVGIVFSIADREETRPDHKFKQWATPFLTGPAALETLKQTLADIAAGRKMDS
jgi:hypothetical protein